MLEHAAPYLADALQLGGIRTGTLDHPQPLGGQSCRVALVDTGSGLRYTVALDRGGDLIDAVHQGCPLAFLTGNGCMPPAPAHQKQMHWLQGWAGGLVTTCGPLNIGEPRPDDPLADGLHGRFSNLPASVIAIENPDLQKPSPDFAIRLRIEDSRMYGPRISIQRTIGGRLGESKISIRDTVTNLGNAPAPHHWLYHINLGYPLLSLGAQIHAQGEPLHRWGTAIDQPLKDFLKIPDLQPAHNGEGSAGIIFRGDSSKISKLSLTSADRQRTLQISYSGQTLEKFAIWQHFASGSYVCGLEPFHGSLMTEDRNDHDPSPTLEPQESVDYQLDIEIV